MSIGQVQIDAAASPSPAEAGETLSRTPPPWSSIWQVPVGVLSIGVIVLAVLYARSNAPEHDFDGALGQIESMTASGQVDEAADRLRVTVLPHLHEAAETQQARAHALAGDLVWLTAERRGAPSSVEYRILDERYEQALALGWSFTPSQVERWATALVAMEEPAKARRRLDLLDVPPSETESRAEGDAVRSRVLRLVAQAYLKRSEAGIEDRIQMLQAYRAAAGGASDAVWAIVREAEVRLEAEKPREAVDRLQVDLRRLEAQFEGEMPPLGEIYATLARGYFELGDTGFAQLQTDRALAALEQEDPARVGALVILGRIRVAQAAHEEAVDAFTEAADIDQSGSAWAAAMLGKADVLGVLGRHDESQDSYRALVDALSRRAYGWGVTPEVVAERLGDRHDAALATRQFDLALSYMEIAQDLFPADRVPEPVLRRLATTNRVLADDWMARAVDELGEIIEPAAHSSAVRFYRRAAQAFLARAQLLQSSPLHESAWAESVWQAADCSDLAGYHEESIRQFETFMMTRSDDDPRWLDAAWRLARCRQAVGDLQGAAELFEEVIQTNPTSVVAARSHVPLAACYEALGAASLAEQQLLQVVSGAEPLRPAAADYRDALTALGSLYHDSGEYARAIEVLERALGHAGDVRRLNDVTFRLADSYRQSARALERIEAAGGDSGGRLGAAGMPNEGAMQAPGGGTSAARTVLRREHLTRALELFESIIDASDRRELSPLGELGRDRVRLAHLYVADCAFGLADYPKAIELYDRAAQRYADEPSSVTALIQIVNAYVRLGDQTRALAAHNRVLHKLEQIPEEALAGDDAVFDEAAWRAWLEMVPPGTARRAGANEP